MTETIRYRLVKVKEQFTGRYFYQIEEEDGGVLECPFQNRIGRFISKRICNSKCGHFNRCWGDKIRIEVIQ